MPAAKIRSRITSLFGKKVSQSQQTGTDLERFYTVSSELLCIIGPDGRYKDVSPSFVRILGHDVGELRGQPFQSFVHSDDWADTEAQIRSLVRGNALAISFDNRCRCKDGSYRRLRWTATAFPDGLTYAAGRDRTDQLHAEQEILHLKAIISSQSRPSGTVPVESPGAMPPGSLLEVLAKPVDPQVLFETVSRILTFRGIAEGTALIIADQSTDLEYLAHLLMKRRLRVLKAYGSEKGIDMAIRHIPDLVILDLARPEADAAATIDRLRRCPETQTTPVLLASEKPPALLHLRVTSEQVTRHNS